MDRSGLATTRKTRSDVPTTNDWTPPAGSKRRDAGWALLPGYLRERCSTVERLIESAIQNAVTDRAIDASNWLDERRPCTSKGLPGTTRAALGRPSTWSKPEPQSASEATSLDRPNCLDPQDGPHAGVAHFQKETSPDSKPSANRWGPTGSPVCQRSFAGLLHRAGRESRGAGQGLLP